MKRLTMYVSNEKDLNENELKTGYVSYARLCDRIFSDMILCNNIMEVDDSIIDNLELGDFYDYYDDEGNEYTKEEYENDTDGKIYEQARDFYQYFIVNLNISVDYIKEHYGDCVTLMYSDKLDNYILAVDHFGTSWSYVETSIKWTTNLNDVLENA